MPLRFYDKADLLAKGVGHYKLKCEGSVSFMIVVCEVLYFQVW